MLLLGGIPVYVWLKWRQSKEPPPEPAGPLPGFERLLPPPPRRAGSRVPAGSK